MNQGEVMVMNGLRAENKALKMQLQDLINQNQQLVFMEKIMSAAITGASMRLTEREAVEYAFRLTDMVMMKMETKAKEEVKPDANT